MDMVTPAAVWVGPERRLVYNEAYAARLEWREAGALGRPGAEVWEDIWEWVREDVEAAFAGESRHHADARVQLARPGGAAETGWFTYSFTPLRGDDGTVFGAFNGFHETTERIRAVQTSAGLLQLALASAGVGTWVLDVASGRVDRSAIHDRIYGYAERIPDWDLERFREHVLPEDRARVDQGMEDSLRTGEVGLEFRIRRVDGSVRWVRIAGEVERDGDEERRMLGIVEDVTERKLDDERRAYLLALNDAIRGMAHPTGVLMASAALLGRHLHASRCHYVEVHQEEGWATIEAEWLRGDVPSARGRYVLADFAGSIERLRRRDEAVVVVDSVRTRETLDAKEREALTRNGIESLIVVPLARGSSIVALLMIADDSPREWSALAPALARQTAERTWSEMERVRAESNAREGEQRLRSVLDTTLDAIYRVNLQTGRFEYFSPAFESVVGLPPERLLEGAAAEAVELVHSEDRERVAEGLSHLHANGSVRLEYRALGTDGGYRWLSNHLALTSDGEGRPLYRDGTVRDITLQKLAEEALRASELRYRSLYENIDEGFAIVDMIFEGDRAVDYRFVDVNPAFERHTGIVDPVGRRARELAPGLEDHWFSTYGEVAKTGRAIRFQAPAESLHRIYDVYAFRLDEDDGHRVAAIFQDISERIHVEEQLRESDRRKDEYLAMLGHELRNPLGAIRYATQLLQQMGAPDATTGRIHEVLHRQAGHMSRIIDGLLDVSRIAQGKLRIEPNVFDLRQVVGWVVAGKQLGLVSKVTLDEVLPERPVWVHADESRIAQVLDNLLANAIKFTPEGEVRVGLRQQGGQAVLEVVDTGVGIRAEMLEHIFEPFHQEAQDIARSNGGLGLGLAFAKGLVEMHEGSIEARSAGRGRGTEIEVRLPLAPSPAVDSDLPPSTVARSILLVEDHPDAAAMLRELLESVGHRVTVVERAADALELLARSVPDLVLCDLGLPAMSGFEFARTWRSGERGGRLPLVAITGYSQREDREESRAAGFDAHVVKPVSLGSLLRVIDEVSPAPS
tara:strand:- start:1563 stop:4646 length:3084 start_codon:yes stop_codon:yes gene_type:complete